MNTELYDTFNKIGLSLRCVILLAESIKIYINMHYTTRTHRCGEESAQPSGAHEITPSV